MDLAYVQPRVIFETVVGSRAYGIHTPESDYDKNGVMIPGREYFYGFDRFEQYRDFPGEDKVIYDIRKALKLISDNNPNMMDLLWVPQRCIIKTTPWWNRILEKRDLFVSKRCRYTFSGYAIAQLNRIKTHRKFLLDPPKEPPSRTELGLPEKPLFPTSQLKAVCYAALEAIIEEERENFIAELDGIYGDYVVPLLSRFLIPEQRNLAMEWFQLGVKSQAKAFLSLGTQYVRDEYVDMAKKELNYYDAMEQWKRYQQWKKSRNKKRAVLEEQYGFDTKHAAHLVRLKRMGEEILETGQVNVDRTGIDAEELVAIRNGAWSYEKIEAYASDEALLDDLYKSTSLRRSSDYKAINELCIDTVEEFLAHGMKSDIEILLGDLTDDLK